jgi:hypothetical protein
MGIFAFAEGFDNGETQAGRALALTANLREMSRDDPSFPLIFGFGLVTAPIREMVNNLKLVVAIDARLAPINPAQLVPLQDMEDIYQSLAGLFPTPPDWLGEVSALGMNEIALQLAPGDRVQATLGGAVGCSLSWLGGSGFAMSGHVASVAGAAVMQQTTRVGTVRWANNPTGNGQNPAADFSIVELAPNANFQPTYSSHVQARPYDTVHLVRSGGGTLPTSMIIGMMVSMALPTHNSTVGDVYLTAGQFTISGDSGAPLINNQSEVIGHVIGASPGFTTIVQDLAYQLKSAPSSFANLGM